MGVPPVGTALTLIDNFDSEIRPMKAIHLAELLRDVPADADIELRLLHTPRNPQPSPLLVWRLSGSVFGADLLRTNENGETIRGKLA